jgi:hypothetical protein
MQEYGLDALPGYENAGNSAETTAPESCRLLPSFLVLIVVFILTAFPRGGGRGGPTVFYGGYMGGGFRPGVSAALEAEVRWRRVQRRWRQLRRRWRRQRFLK